MAFEVIENSACCLHDIFKILAPSLKASFRAVGGAVVNAGRHRSHDVVVKKSLLKYQNSGNRRSGSNTRKALIIFFSRKPSARCYYMRDDVLACRLCFDCFAYTIWSYVA